MSQAVHYQMQPTVQQFLIIPSHTHTMHSTKTIVLNNNRLQQQIAVQESSLLYMKMLTMLFSLSLVFPNRVTNEVFLSVSHECLIISTPFSLQLFFSGSEFWPFQLQIYLSICHNRCRSYVTASFPWHLKNTLLTEQLLLELVTCPALDLCFLHGKLAFALRQHCRNFVCIAVQWQLHF